MRGVGACKRCFTSLQQPATKRRDTQAVHAGLDGLETEENRPLRKSQMAARLGISSLITPPTVKLFIPRSAPTSRLASTSHRLTHLRRPRQRNSAPDSPHRFAHRYGTLSVTLLTSRTAALTSTSTTRCRTSSTPSR